jgi:23S rRNA (adenine2503-C2)-methyltransferase
MGLRSIKSLTLEAVQAEFRAWGEPPYRATQVVEWLYAGRATDWMAMTNLPQRLRERLAQNYSLTGLELVLRQGSADATQKFLWRLADRALIESVLIPANPALYGEASDRHTLCVSTQVGCAYGCRFCASGIDGWKRNLGADEIVDQVLAVERWYREQAVMNRRPPEPAVGGSPASPAGNRHEAPITSGGSTAHAPSPFATAEPDPQATEQARPAGAHEVPPWSAGSRHRLIDNLVVMGMGEPLANYDNLMQALRILNAPWGGGIGARKITVSTAGLCPQIRRLAEEPHQFRLAISLHGATDEVRNRLMPVNRKHPLSELLAACVAYQAQKGRLITFEYLLIAGVNDGIEQVRPLASLTRRVHAKLNLIPYNRVEGLAWERPSEAHQEAFRAALEAQGVAATLRREKGHDIAAACGQLRLRTERAWRR